MVGWKKRHAGRREFLSRRIGSRRRYGRTGRAAASAARRLGRIRCRCGRRGRFRGRRGALARVVVHIKSGAFEVQARCRERALQHPLAQGANKLELGIEVLDFLKAMTALGAAIGIQRQSQHPSWAIDPIYLLYRQKRNCLQTAGGMSRRTFAIKPSQVQRPRPPGCTRAMALENSAVDAMNRALG
jgi:hypothetical protein